MKNIKTFGSFLNEDRYDDICSILGENPKDKTKAHIWPALNKAMTDRSALDVLNDEEKQAATEFLDWVEKTKHPLSAGNFYWSLAVFKDTSRGNRINHIGLF